MSVVVVAKIVKYDVKWVDQELLLTWSGGKVDCWCCCIYRCLLVGNGEISKLTPLTPYVSVNRVCSFWHRASDQAWAADLSHDGIQVGTLPTNQAHINCHQVFDSYRIVDQRYHSS